MCSIYLIAMQARREILSLKRIRHWVVNSVNFRQWQCKNRFISQERKFNKSLKNSTVSITNGNKCQFESNCKFWEEDLKKTETEVAKKCSDGDSFKNLK